MVASQRAVTGRHKDASLNPTQGAPENTNLDAPSGTRAASPPFTLAARSMSGPLDPLSPWSDLPWLCRTEARSPSALNGPSPSFGANDCSPTRPRTRQRSSPVLNRPAWTSLGADGTARGGSSPNFGEDSPVMLPRKPSYRKHSPICATREPGDHAESVQLQPLEAVQPLGQLQGRHVYPGGGGGSQHPPSSPSTSPTGSTSDPFRPRNGRWSGGSSRTSETGSRLSRSLTSSAAGDNTASEVLDSPGRDRSLSLASPQWRVLPKARRRSSRHRINVPLQRPPSPSRTDAGALPDARVQTHEDAVGAMEDPVRLQSKSPDAECAGRHPSPKLVVTCSTGQVTLVYEGDPASPRGTAPQMPSEVRPKAGPPPEPDTQAGASETIETILDAIGDMSFSGQGPQFSEFLESLDTDETMRTGNKAARNRSPDVVLRDADVSESFLVYPAPRGNHVGAAKDSSGRNARRGVAPEVRVRASPTQWPDLPCKPAMVLGAAAVVAVLAWACVGFCRLLIPEPTESHQLPPVSPQQHSALGLADAGSGPDSLIETLRSLLADPLRESAAACPTERPPVPVGGTGTGGGGGAPTMGRTVCGPCPS